MVPTFRLHRASQAIVTVLFITAFLLSSCSADTTTPTIVETSPAPSETEVTSSPAPTDTATSTPTLLPTVSTTTSGFGLIVFSMADGAYKHLYVYDPYSLPMTHLTGSDWDDTDPAISPDGRSIAFASNRNGQWDIYILNLTTDETIQVTNTKTYDGAPTWSPDGQYLVFQTKNGNQINLVIQSIADSGTAPIQITEDAGVNFDAAWSPDGRQIAFITNRSGRNELWLFDLKSTDNRFTIVASSDKAGYFSPAWSPDGSTLAWCKKDSEDHIETLPIALLGSSPKEVGIGCSPAWSPDGRSILATYQQANSQYLVAYDVTNDILSLPMIDTQAKVDSTIWLDAATAKFLLTYVNLQTLPTPSALFTTVLSLPDSGNGRSGVVEIKSLNAPNPYLADSADESFKALRQAFGKKVGWDFLGTLDDAYLPLTGTTYPGIIENWLYSGRAIAITSGALSANWLVVTREDFAGETYWRVWVKCQDQTGVCGEPILSNTWDFSARNSGNLQAYEDGGKLSDIPKGYWVDFTEFASRYGWDRLPAQNDWRYYSPGTLFNQFVFRQGLTWQQAMLQLYPEEAIELLNPEN